MNKREWIGVLQLFDAATVAAIYADASAEINYGDPDAEAIREAVPDYVITFCSAVDKAVIRDYLSTHGFFFIPAWASG